MEFIVANLEQHFNSLKKTGQTTAGSRDTIDLEHMNLSPTSSVDTDRRFVKLAQPEFTHSSFGSYNRKMHKTSSGVSYGQPQFFSPVYTPINWQIPSRRREVYMWSWLPGNDLQLFDGTPITVSDVVETDRMLTHIGTVGEVDRTTIREVDTTAFKVSFQGYYKDFEITKGHKVLAIPLEEMRGKHSRGGKSGRGFCCEQHVCKRTGCNELKTRTFSPVSISVEDLREGDYLYTPIPRIILNSEVDSVSKARLLGYYCAGGSLFKEKEKSSESVVAFTFNVSEHSCIEEVQSLCRELAGDDVVIVRVYDRHEKNITQILVESQMIWDMCNTHCGHIPPEKRMSEELFYAPIEFQKEFLGAYWNVDGSRCFTTGNDGKIDFRTASRSLADQLIFVLARCGYPASCFYSRIKNDKSGMFTDKNSSPEFFDMYTVRVGFINIGDFFCYADLHVSDESFHTKNSIRIVGDFLVRQVTKIESRHYKGLVYDVRVPGEFTVVCSMVAMHQCRYWYENEPRLATAIDLYSRFPITSFETECKDRYVKHYFDELNKQLDLDRWLRIISHEVHLLGDCYPFLEVDCPHCGGTGRVGSNICDHPGGSFKRLLIMNPDFIEVFTNPLAPENVITYLPDDELRDLVLKGRPGSERLSADVKQMVAQGQPIPLDNLSISHLKYGESGYRRYGISMIRRLFPILSYKTKIMTAQWIVAERMIIPIKVVKVGSDERPASDNDIAAVQAQLMASSNDPNLCLVTHHAFDLEWYGACHSEDTEVLTENGWKFYDAVCSGEKIANYNIDTGAIEFEVPEELHVYDYDGDLVHFQSKHYDVLVTPNHSMLASTREWDNNSKCYIHGSFKKVRADNVGENSCFISMTNWVGHVPESLPYRSQPYLSNLSLDRYLEFIGFYISEGGVKQFNGTNYSWSITQSVVSSSFSAVRELVNLVSDVVREFRDDRGNSTYVQFHIDNSLFARFMADEFGDSSTEKRIPRWVMSLPKRELSIVLTALMKGDGDIRLSANGFIRCCYSTVSKVLADQVQEIAFKLGFDPKISVDVASLETRNDVYRVYWAYEDLEKGTRVVKERNISRERYIGKVWCFTTKTGFFVTRRNGKIGVHGNSGKILQVSGEYEFINQEILDGVGLNKQLITGEGPTYSSAAMGAEIMIRRFESWRQELKRWVERNIYLPVAKMKGFVEENEWGEPEFIYPKIKWDSLNLRDRQSERQMILNLYEKGLVSARTTLQEFDIDPDAEFEQLRYERIEQAYMAQPGMIQGGGGDMGMGGLGEMGMGGGGGGLELGGGLGPEGMPGGEMGGMPGGEMGGMPGGEMGGMPGGAPAGGGMGLPAANLQTVKIAQADPSMYGGKVLTEKTRQKLDKEREKMTCQQQDNKHHGRDDDTAPGDEGFQRDKRGRVFLTGLEKDVLQGIEERQRIGAIRYNCYPSLELAVGDPQPLVIDMAFPDLRVAVECDGAKWHDSPKDEERDKKRDAKLNRLGWVVLRFKEKEIERNLSAVLDKIVKVITQRESYFLQEREKIQKKREKQANK